MALIFLGVIYLGFFVNIPFYIAWLKRQEVTDELFLYSVGGKFTYRNVVDWITRIEEATGRKLIKERKQIDRFLENCEKRKKPLKVYKRKIYRMLKDESFGKQMVRNAFKRMPVYSKITAFWEVLIVFSFMYALSSNADVLASRIVGVLLGAVVASPFFLMAHKFFNWSLKQATIKEMKKHPNGTMLQAAMAHFWGFTSGVLWKDLHWNDAPVSYMHNTAGYRYGVYHGYSYGGSSYGGGGGFGGFGGGDFGGGGAGGDW